MFLSTFNCTLPEAGDEGFYLPVKNDTQGINQPIFDYSAQFGSNSKLQGTIDMGNKLPLAAARFKNPDGSMNMTLLGKDSAHWSYLLDTKGSLMYGNGWRYNSDGTFTATSARSGYS